MGLIMVNLAVFIYELTLGSRLDGFVQAHGMIPTRVTEMLRESGLLAGGLRALPEFFTSLFLHGGVLHVAGNMWYLWIFGDNVEDRLGHRRFLVFYLFCGLAAGVAQYVMQPYVALPTIGASGAIAGVLGAYIISFPKARILTLIPIFFIPIFVELSAFFFLGLWLVFQLVAGRMSLVHTAAGTDVAYWAHIGGFAIGALLVTLLPRHHKARQERYAVWYD